MRSYVRTLPDFTKVIQSRNETTRKSNAYFVSTSAENGLAMAGPAGLVPAPMSDVLIHTPSHI